MKKFLLLIICFLVLVAPSFSQVNNFAIGPEGGPGVNILWPKSSTPLSYNMQRKPSIGGIVGYAFQYNFSSILAIKTSLSYERKGSDYKGFDPATTYFTAHAKYDYLTLPILVRATFGNKVRFFINAGPYVSVLLRQQFVVQDPLAGKQVTNNTGSDKLFDTGITAGAGILYFFAGQYGISFEARNDLGLYNTNRPSNSETTLRTNSTNFIFGFEYKLVTHKAPKKQKAD